MSSYKHCPMCSAPLVVKSFEGKDKKACPACDFVHWDNPLPVAAIVIPHGEDGVVLVKRGMPPKVGDWALAAGYVDTCEDPLSAAIREAKEETGLDIKIKRLLGIFAPPGRNQFMLIYLAHPVTADPQPGSDALEAKVFKYDELPENMAFPLHVQALKRYAKNLKRNRARRR